MICKNCLSDTTTTDSAQGVIYCTSCGMVQEESIIVNSINFTDNGVKSSLNGQIVNMGSKHVGTQYVDSNYYIKNTITNICTTICLGKQFVDCSFRYYRLLLPYNLSKGKSILYTLSACIYIVCREEKTPHLLIDFSNALNIDVFKIGKSFTKIVEILNLKISNTDPTMYIHRYAIKLDLYNPKITEMALRIISRMNRDWITTGRRPNNLCGVAILISSRVFNEEKSLSEVAKVVNVSVSTLKKRLVEISETSAANLNIREFNKEWFIKEEDPPIVKNSIKRKLKAKVFEEPKSNEEFVLEDEILNEKEFNERKAVWENMYEDYVIEKENRDKIVKAKTRINIRKQYKNVSDVLKSMNKRVSSKINYDVIQNIFEDF